MWRKSATSMALNNCLITYSMDSGRVDQSSGI
jgi:hypothetical protein